LIYTKSNMRGTFKPKNPQCVHHVTHTSKSSLHTGNASARWWC
jgi:hypothetical protein